MTARSRPFGADGSNTPRAAGPYIMQALVDLDSRLAFVAVSDDGELVARLCG